jgi:hypothetical protein
MMINESEGLFLNGYELKTLKAPADQPTASPFQRVCEEYFQLISCTTQLQSISIFC